MSLHRKQTRRQEREQPSSNQRVIDIGVTGVIARTMGNEEERIHLVLDGDKQLFSKFVDACVYANGWVETANQNKPGNEASRGLAIRCSLVPGVRRVQYQFRTGMYVNLDFGDPRFVEILATVATMMLEEADLFSRNPRR